MYSLFTDNISNLFSKLNYEKIFEIRIKVGCPIKLLYENQWGYLSKDGFSLSDKNCLIISESDVNSIVVKATDYSLYSACDSLLSGYIALSNGLRIGVCGEAVILDGKLRTFKNFTSVVIRLPHAVLNASAPIMDYITRKNQIYNTLIVSPPGGGKTTVLRDIARVLSEKYNVLIIDERREIAGINGCIFSFDLKKCDVVSGAKKSLVLENVIRSCAPDLIITDEISDTDYQSIRYAVSCGVNVITSIHSSSFENLLKKPNFEKFFSDKVFKRYIVLKGRENPGKLSAIFDEDFSRIL